VETGPALIIQAWLDGSPDDCVCYMTERWHTIAFVQMPRNGFERELRLAKWSDLARKSVADGSRRGYKKEFMHWLYTAMIRGDVSFDAYTFRDSQIVSLIGAMTRNFKLDQCVTFYDGSVRLQIPDKIPVEVDQESFSYLMVLAEVLGTIMWRATKQIEGKELPLFFLVTLDKVKGDTATQLLRGQILKEVLGRVGLWQIDMRYHSESDTLPGDLLADNISGCLNAAITNEDSIYGAFMAVVKNQQIRRFGWNVLVDGRWLDWWEVNLHSRQVSRKTLKRLGIALQLSAPEDGRGGYPWVNP
jgi:hypothetical protein